MTLLKGHILLLLACETCFGAGTDSPVVTAIGLSMLGLLLVIGFVLTGVTTFFVNMERRARILERKAKSIDP